MVRSAKGLMIKIMILLISALFCFNSGKALATDVARYPEKDIVCIAPAGPGGGFDLILRTAAPYIRRYLPKQVNVVVQNVPAAGGRVGNTMIYDAKPDGYTLGIVEPVGIAVAAAMEQLGNRDFLNATWLCRASTHPYALAISPQSPIQKIEDFKGKKGQKIYASASFNTVFGSVAVLKFLGVEPQMVIYGGGAESCLAVMRGDVDLVIQVAGTVLRQAEASGGKLIPLAVFVESRLSIAPELPTAKELGVHVPKDIMSFLTHDYVFVAPPGLPPEVYRILSDALDKTVRDPSFAEQLQRLKLTVNLQSGDEVQKNLTALYKVMPQYIEIIKQAIQK